MRTIPPILHGPRPPGDVGRRAGPRARAPLRLMVTVAFLIFSGFALPTGEAPAETTLPRDPCGPPPTEVSVPRAIPSTPRRGRDVWSVVTRGLPDIYRMPTEARPRVERIDEDGCWRRADLEGIFDTPGQPILVFIHGNRYDHGSAREQGLTLAARAGAICPEVAGARTVIFSWPSDQQGILLRDSRAKYERATTEGHYLAWLLARVEPDRPVAIVGYSYGSLIALEALEDLVHAQAAGREGVQPWIGRTAPLHLVLVAAAVRQDALAPRGPYRETLPCIDRLTLLYNSDDMALRFFELVDRRLRTEALGHRGMPARWLPRGMAFAQVDAAPVVGCSHRFKDYLASPGLTGRICIGAGRGLCCEEPLRANDTGADMSGAEESPAPPACPCDLMLP